MVKWILDVWGFRQVYLHSMIHMKRKYRIGGWILLPTPGRAGNGRLPTGAEYSSVHPPAPPKEPVGKLRPAPPPRVEVFPPGNFHFPVAPTGAVGASRASKAHIEAAQILIREFEN